MTRRIAAAAVLGLVAGFAATADAALLMNDPAALPSWTGTRGFYQTDGTYTLDVTVDYAVFAPGAYAGVDPSGGSEYVYAYQVRNLIDLNSVEISTLTVGILPLTGAHNLNVDSTYALLGGLTPSTVSMSSSSARWFFGADTIDAGEWSEVLLFTSPNGPRWLSGSVADGGLSDRQAMPSPTPEPMTLALLTLGGAALVGSAARRRRIR
jgi:hypothetical protein